MRLAVIPARAGSKRIPGKNIRNFAGRPIIGWVIEAARDSGIFDRIVVSTDSDEVAAVAESEGAEVPFRRSPELSDDNTGTLEVIADAAGWAVRHESVPTAICCLYATASLVDPHDVVRACELLETAEWDYVFAGAQYSYPVQRSLVRRDGGGVSLLWPEHRLTRSQDLTPVYHDAGLFYWGRTESWIGLKPILSESSTFVDVPAWRVQDIDTPEDWVLAEHKFLSRRRVGHGG